MSEKEFRVLQMGVLKTLRGKSIKECISILNKTIEFLNIVAVSNELVFDDDWSERYIDDSSN